MKTRFLILAAALIMAAGIPAQAQPLTPQEKVVQAWHARAEALQAEVDAISEFPRVVRMLGYNPEEGLRDACAFKRQSLERALAAKEDPSIAQKHAYEAKVRGIYQSRQSAKFYRGFASQARGIEHEAAAEKWEAVAEAYDND